MSLRDRGLQPTTNVLSRWNVSWSWTPYKAQGSVASSAALPTGLGNDSDDQGKGWIATNTGLLHVWTGTGWDSNTTPSYWNAKTVITNVHAKDSADALAKVQRLTLMQHTINAVSYGSPATGWNQPNA